MPFKRIRKVLDNCEVCNGKRGGTPGNENICNVTVAGTPIKYTITVCDYCHSDWFS